MVTTCEVREGAGVRERDLDIVRYGKIEYPRCQPGHLAAGAFLLRELEPPATFTLFLNGIQRAHRPVYPGACRYPGTSSVRQPECDACWIKSHHVRLQEECLRLVR
jgi:hypothetical protein